MEDYGRGGGGYESSDGEENGDIYQDMRDFDKRLKTKADDPFFSAKQQDSSDEETVGGSG